MDPAADEAAGPVGPNEQHGPASRRAEGSAEQPDAGLEGPGEGSAAPPSGLDIELRNLKGLSATGHLAGEAKGGGHWNGGGGGGAAVRSGVEEISREESSWSVMTGGDQLGGLPDMGKRGRVLSMGSARTHLEVGALAMARSKSLQLARQTSNRAPGPGASGFASVLVGHPQESLLLADRKSRLNDIIRQVASMSASPHSPNLRPSANVSNFASFDGRLASSHSSVGKAASIDTPASQQHSPRLKALRPRLANASFRASTMRWGTLDMENCLRNLLKDSVDGVLPRLPSEALSNMSVQRRGAVLENPLLRLIDQCTLANTTDELQAAAESRRTESKPVSLLTARLGATARKLIGPPDMPSENRRLPLSVRMKVRMMRTVGLEQQFKDVDGDVESITSHWGLMVRATLLFGLAGIDFIAALVVVFWGLDDPYCYHSLEDPDNPNSVGRENTPRSKAMALITAILLLYMVNLVINMVEMDGQGHMKLYTAVSHAFADKKSSGAGGKRAVLVAMVRVVQVTHVYVLEGCLLLLSMILTWMHFSKCFVFDYAADAAADYSFTVVRRLQIVVHFFRSLTELWRCFDLRNDLRKRLQSAVSLNKRRFVDVQNKLDLDLTYICDRLIAMGIPCVDGAVYRNDIREVSRFFATRHYGSYLVFNLCQAHEEGGNGNYDTMLLYGQVQKLPFPDHNAPPIEWLVRFCEQASAWLDMRPQNVVAVHCQGGKGRTGCFCSSLLLWTGYSLMAQEGMDYFAHRRTDRRRRGGAMQEVTAPCQKRYVSYIKKILNDSTLDFRSAPTKILNKVTIMTMPHVYKESLHVTFIVESEGRIVYDNSKANGLVTLQSSVAPGPYMFEFEGIAVAADVSVRFFFFENEAAAAVVGMGEHVIHLREGSAQVRVNQSVGKQLFFITFNTAFHDDPSVVRFSRQDIDVAYNSSVRKFSEDFSVELHFTDRKIEGRGLLSSSVEISPEMLAVDRLEMSALSFDARLLRINKNVRAIMNRLSPAVQEYKLGEIMYDPLDLDADGQTIYFISEGSAVWEDVRGEDALFFVENASSTHGMAQKEGRFYGILEMITPGAGFAGSILRAATHKVIVRKVKLTKVWNLHVPIHVEGAMDWEECMLFQQWCTEILAVGNYVQQRLSRLEMESRAKHDTNTSMTSATKAEAFRSLVKKFNIPTTEQLLNSSSVTVWSDAMNDKMERQVYLFSSWIIFSSKDSKLRDQLIPISSLQSLAGEDDIVRFTCVADKDPESSSPNGSPNVQSDDRRDSLRLSKDGNGTPGGQGRRKSWMYNLPCHLSGSFTSWSLDGPEKRGAFKDAWHTCLDLIYGRQTIKDLLWASETASSNAPAAAGLKSLGLRRMSQCYRQQEPLDTGTINVLFPDKASMREFKTSAQRCRDDIARATGVRRFFREQAKSRSKAGEKAGWKDFGYIMPGDDSEGEEVLVQLFERATELCYGPGAVIMSKGTTAKNLFHVQSGSVQLISKKGEILHELVPGDMFGAENFVESGNMGHRYNAIATTHVQVMSISQEQVDSVCSSSPRAGSRIYRNMAISLNLKLQIDFLAMKAWHRT